MLLLKRHTLRKIKKEIICHESGKRKAESDKVIQDNSFDL